MGNPKASQLKKDELYRAGLGLRCCAGCGTIPPEGPLAYEWDSHWRDGAMFSSCSDECRASLGVSRRKPVVVPQPVVELVSWDDMGD